MRQWEENKVMKLFGRNFSLICHEGKHDDETKTGQTRLRGGPSDKLERQHSSNQKKRYL